MNHGRPQCTNKRASSQRADVRQVALPMEYAAPTRIGNGAATATSTYSAMCAMSVREKIKLQSDLEPAEPSRSTFPDLHSRPERYAEVQYSPKDMPSHSQSFSPNCCLGFLSFDDAHGLACHSKAMNQL